MPSLTPILALALGVPVQGPIHLGQWYEDNCPAGKAAWLGAAVGPTKLAEQEVEKAEV